ncbi:MULTISPECIES: IpaB/EvcA family protein [Providencia]|uniref:IpaB/EvcA family protein n=1 Tax=Providencia TaxID=586 RepID=UPI0012B622D3|nr:MULTISPECIES: IpaB/EvcA family protein [Providencia]MTC57050.1 IpaB/EvcA family protein [Providencia rustigianii]
MFTSSIKATKPIQITSKVEIKKEYGQLSQKLLNVSNKFISFTVNKQSISINKAILMSDVLKAVQKSNPKDTQAIAHWKEQERVVQLSATFNQAFDAVIDAFISSNQDMKFRLSLQEKTNIFNEIKGNLQFGEYQFNKNAAQKSLEHVLRNNSRIKEITTLLIQQNKISDTKSVRYVTNYIIEAINNELCQTLFPELPLREISVLATELTSLRLFDKSMDQMKYDHWKAHYKLPSSGKTIML